MKLWSKFMFLRHSTMLNPDFGVVVGVVGVVTSEGHSEESEGLPSWRRPEEPTYAEQMRESVDVTLRRDTLA